VQQQFEIIAISKCDQANLPFGRMKKSTLLSKIFAAALGVAIIGIAASCRTNSRGPIRETDYSAPIRVACVGDSITWGYGIPDREHKSYPAQLAALLGKKWDVRNFGVNGATALKHGTLPYNQQQAFRDALSFEPDVVVIKLGTNDTNAKSWPAHKKEFLSDYLDLIRSFAELKTRPRIFLCRPVPLFRDRGKDYDTDKILTEEVIPKINEAAKEMKLSVIDLYAPFEGKAELFPDGVHPNAEGAGIMAREVYAKFHGQK
jgi:lysophospholipase L1-like esterase